MIYVPPHLIPTYIQQQEIKYSPNIRKFLKNTYYEVPIPTIPIFIKIISIDNNDYTVYQIYYLGLGTRKMEFYKGTPMDEIEPLF